MFRLLLSLALLALLAGVPYLAGVAAALAVVAGCGGLLFGPRGRWL